MKEVFSQKNLLFSAFRNEGPRARGRMSTMDREYYRRKIYAWYVIGVAVVVIFAVQECLYFVLSPAVMSC